MFSSPGIVTLGYVVKMALDSSFQRADSRDTQAGETFADDDLHAPPPAIRPGSLGISVTLWDEVPRAPDEAPPAPSRPAAFDDDSPGS
jgi:hypothetical protein